MTAPKSLGQIAYEEYTNDRFRRWADLLPSTREAYERMATAVARAVKRRGKKENKE